MAQNVKTLQGVAIASVKTVQGVAIANVKTIQGVDNTGGGGSPTWYGFEGATGASESITTSAVFDVPILVGQTGDITQVRLYIGFTNNTSTLVRVAVYDTSNNLFTGTGTTSGAVGSGDDRWFTFSLAASAPVTSGNTYKLAFAVSIEAGITINCNNGQPAGTSHITFSDDYTDMPLASVAGLSNNTVEYKVQVLVE